MGAGQEQSARLIDELTAYVCDLEVERAEALLPEVKALSRTLNNPWLEIFVRHWEMRNRVGNQLEGETALADAVSLFELANRDDTQACPQSVCVTQDLASCYANVDGPGWVEERIEVCDETLARIDPTWACFHCLSNEKAEALLDDGRGEDALAFLAEQEKKILAAGEEVFDSLLEMRVAILLNLGRAEQALAPDRRDGGRRSRARSGTTSASRGVCTRPTAWRCWGATREAPGGAAAVLRDCPALSYDLAARRLLAAATDP